MPGCRREKGKETLPCQKGNGTHIACRVCAIAEGGIPSGVSAYMRIYVVATRPDCSCAHPPIPQMSSMLPACCSHVARGPCLSVLRANPVISAAFHESCG